MNLKWGSAVLIFFVLLASNCCFFYYLLEYNSYFPFLIAYTNLFISLFIFNLFIILPRLSLCFCMVAVISLMWACIWNAYPRFLDNCMPLTMLNYAPSSSRYFVWSTMRTHFDQTYTVFSICNFGYQLRIDTTGEARISSVFHPCIERRISSQVSYPLHFIFALL